MATRTSLISTLSSEIASLVEQAGVHIVGVLARARRPASGIALGGDIVLTADHVIERDADLAVLGPNGRFEATLVGRDAATDLAVLRAPGLGAGDLPTADTPPVGSLVVSLARTSAGTLSAGLGVVTSVGGPLRTGRGVVLRQVIRTDAALRPATSGGAIVDAAGRVLGMTTSGLLRGLPVAIPTSSAREIAERLIAKRPLGRGYLGITVQPVRVPERQRASQISERGLLIFGLLPEGAADRAGAMVGDILVRFGEHSVDSLDTLQDALAATDPGIQSSIAVLRGGSLQELPVTVGERPEG